MIQLSYNKKSILWGTLTVILLRIYFCITYLPNGSINALIGSLTILSLGLRMGRKTQVFGVLGTIGSFLTVLVFLFSAIPTYTHIPSLDGFYSSDFPRILCPTNVLDGNILIQNTTVTIENICNRNGLAVFVGQKIQNLSEANLFIYLTRGKSGHIPPQTIGEIINTNSSITNPDFSLMINTQVRKDSTITATENQILLDYTGRKREYLRTNFGRQREESRLVTQLAKRKMRLLRLIDRTYESYTQGFEFYLKNTE